MSHWPFHSDFMEDIFVLQVRKRPGAGIAGLQKLRRIGILSKLISLYPVNCFLKSEHITLETVRFSVRVRMHTGVQRWVLVLVNQFLYFSRIAFSCINTCCLYILITEERKAKNKNSCCVKYLQTHDTRMYVQTPFVSKWTFASLYSQIWHVFLQSVVLDVLDVSVFKYSTCLSAVTMVSCTCAGSPSGPLLHSSWIFFISEFASLTCVCIFSLTLCAFTFTYYCLMSYLVVVPVVPVWRSINLIQTSNVKSYTLIFVVVVVVETLNWGAVRIGLLK